MKKLNDITAKTLINIIQKLTWKNPNHKKSNLYITEETQDDFKEKKFLQQSDNLDLFCAYNSKLKKGTYIEKAFLYVDHPIIEFYELEFCWTINTQGKTTLKHLDLSAAFKNKLNYSHIKSITRGKYEVYKALCTKLNQETTKAIKRNSARRLKAQKEKNKALENIFI